MLCCSVHSMNQNQMKFIILWLFTSHCGVVAAQKISDVNFNDKVISNCKMPATCMQSYRLQKETKFYLNLKIYRCM